MAAMQPNIAYDIGDLRRYYPNICKERRVALKHTSRYINSMKDCSLNRCGAHIGPLGVPVGEASVGN